MVMRFSKRLVPYEADEQKSYFALVEVRKQSDWRWANIFHVPNGAHLARGARTFNFLKSTGLSPGVPDIVVAMPSFHSTAGVLGGLFIEMKRQGLDLRPEQEEWKKRLIKAHFGYALCYSASAAIEITERWMKESFIAV